MTLRANVLTILIIYFDKYIYNYILKEKKKNPKQLTLTLFMTLRANVLTILIIYFDKYIYYYILK